MQLKRSVSPDWSDYIEIGLGLLALLMTIGVLSGWSLPLVEDYRSAIFWLATLGFGMCTLRLGATLARLGWRHPITLVGGLLGLVMLVLVVGLMSGAALPIGERSLFMLLAAALFVKLGLGVYARQAD
jgi:hypothetical protein